MNSKAKSGAGKAKSKAADAFPELSDMQNRRRRLFLPHVDKNMTALEVGAFYMPTLLPSDVKLIEYADYYSTAELKKQLEGNDYALERLVDVTHVVADKELKDLVKKKYDIIIANHVLEHLINPFGYLKDLEGMLNPGGMIFASLPDKKYSFDRYRPDTTLAHFIADFLSGDGKASLNEACIEAALLYDYSYGGGDNASHRRLNPAAIERILNEGFHPGMHVHVFQGETFLHKVLNPFLQCGFIDYTCVDYDIAFELGEMIFVLKKGASEDAKVERRLMIPHYDSMFV